MEEEWVQQNTLQEKPSLIGSHGTGIAPYGSPSSPHLNTSPHLVHAPPSEPHQVPGLFEPALGIKSVLIKLCSAIKINICFLNFN